MQFAKIELAKDLARHLRAGHPWVYKRALERAPSGLEAGAIVDVTERGKFVARGYYDPLSPIAVRVLTRDPAEAVGPLFWRKKIARAVALRRAFVPLSPETDCCRLVHGEGARAVARDTAGAPQLPGGSRVPVGSRGAGP